MAHLIKPWIVRYLKAGSRVPKGTPGARKFRERSAKWYGQGVPGYSPSKRFPLATDKDAARRMLADLVRRAERGQARTPDREAARLPLREHLVRFESDLAAGLASKGGRRRTVPQPEQVTLVVQRVRDVLDGCGFLDPPDLNTEAPAKLAAYLSARRLLPRKGKGPREESGISAQSASFYLAAARRFVRWLSKRAPVALDLFDELPGFAPHNDRVHARRDVSIEELARLIETARDGEPFRDIAGVDRAVLYLVAFSTGYRAGELAALTPECFDLDAEMPVAVLPARLTKNKKKARQPLPPGVVQQLRAYLTGRPASKTVWPGVWYKNAAAMIRQDLAAAKIPYCLQTMDGDRYADFHALRHSYLSALAAAGVGPKELQELARHSDPRLTLGIYTHTRPSALGESVGRLQLPGATETNPLAKLTRTELEDRVRELESKLQAAETLVARGVALTTRTLANPDEPGRKANGNGSAKLSA